MTAAGPRDLEVDPAWATADPTPLAPEHAQHRAELESLDPALAPQQRHLPLVERSDVRRAGQQLGAAPVEIGQRRIECGELGQPLRVIRRERRRIRGDPRRIERGGRRSGGRHYATADFATSASFAKAAASRTARSASSLRFTSTWARLSPEISVL